MRTGKIDIHTHILPPKWPKFKEQFGYGGFMCLDRAGCGPHRAKMIYDDGRFFREIESNCWDPKIRLSECEGWGVDHQVLSTVPALFSYWAKGADALKVAQFLNDHISGVASDDPARFSGLGSVPLQSPELAIRELERCMRELGMVGVQIGSHVNDWNLDEPALFPFFEAAQALGAAVFIHPWDMMGRERMPKYWLPWLVGMPAESALAICSMIFGGVFERLPKLRVAFAHGGGAFAATLGRIEHGFTSRPDLCAVDNAISPRAYLGRFWVDSLVHDSLALQFILKTFGENRVALGSDYPFPLGEQEPGQLIELEPSLSMETRKRLLVTNALEWMGKIP